MSAAYHNRYDLAIAMAPALHQWWNYVVKHMSAACHNRYDLAIVMAPAGALH